ATRQALASYGENLGISFQIIDDILDLTGEAATVGKTLGRDLEKGKLTLPLIHYLATADAPRRREMLDLLEAVEADPLGHGVAAGNGRLGGDGPITRIRRLVLGSDAIDYARRCAAKLVEAARRRVEA